MRLLASAAAFVLASFSATALVPEPDARALAHSPLPPVPGDPTNIWAADSRAAHLGQYLFFERRLSKNGELSCATCHDPERAFSDGRSLSVGLGEGRRNTPALWNVAWQRWYFWDGRADTLWSQALHPLETEAELGSDRTALALLVDGDPELRAAYEAIFGPTSISERARFPSHAKPVLDNADDPLHRAWLAMSAADRTAVNRIFVNVGKALAAYESRIVSSDSAFDLYVAALRAGDVAAQSAYPDAAKRGLSLFVGKANCKLCHAGPNFTDNEFHNIGVPPLASVTSPGSTGLRDLGRYAGVPLVQRDEFNAKSSASDDPDGPRALELDRLVTSGETWGQIKTPSLRNVALTAPYMHQGQFESLERVLRYYSTLEGTVPAGHHGEQVIRPLHLEESEIRDLSAFLESLTDADLDPRLLAKPDAPRILESRAPPAPKPDDERP